ncbi:MAG TPA: hypothetical protein PLQ34_07835 [Ferrovaceae bacterium]|nr:hypothetical protein [Ferrovaceae bacterium]
MNAKLNNAELNNAELKLVIALDAVTGAWQDYVDAVATYASRNREFSVALLNAMAATIARRFKCNYKTTGGHSFQFYDGDTSSRDTRNNAASQVWKRLVARYFVKQASKSRAVDPVKALMTKFNALTPSQRVKFLNAVQ